LKNDATHFQQLFILYGNWDCQWLKASEI